jgi:predicted dehydrogenase
MIMKPQLVRGWAKEKLKAGLVGCGGRGTQAIIDMMQGTENTEVVAMGDIFEDRLQGSLQSIAKHPEYGKFQNRVTVSPEKRFVGFDAIEKVLKSDIDIVMLCAPPGYRPAHFEAAINAKKHVFCEKPFGVDAVGVRRFMAAAKKSEELKLTVMSGAQRRFDSNYVTTIDKIKNGAIGDVVATYAYWVGTPVIQQKARDPKWGDMTWQHRAWYSFLWICGDQIVEQHLHNIDVCNWVVGAHPVECTASGGAAWRPRDEIYGCIYDHVSADFVYPNGVHMSSYCRQYPASRTNGIATNISELIVGSKGRSKANDLADNARTRPYVAEHTAMANSIRGDGPYVNHAMPVAESTMTCIMGRESAYSGQKITWDMMMNSQQDLTPKAFDYDLKMDVPPLPIPGVYKFV